MLALGLTLVMVLSLFAVPVAGAPPNDAGPSNGNGNSDGGSSGGSNGNSDGGGGASDSSGGGSDSGSNGNSGGGGGASDSSGGGSDSGSNGNSGGGDGASDNSNDNSAGKNNGNSNGGNAGDNGNGNGAGDGNPGGNDNGAKGGNGNSAGGTSEGGPGNSGGAGPPSDAGAPDDAGSPDDRGPPDEAGPPDDAGPPDRTGQPDDAGPPEDAGPTVRVSTGPAEDAGQGGPPDSPPGQSDGASPSSVVDVAVEGAAAGDQVSMDVSPSSVEDQAVAFDGISVRVKRDGDFTMQVTNSREALPGSPDFEPPAEAESLGRVRLDHSITNEEVEEVSFTFRVSKSRLESSDTDMETVALYRHSEGEWTALPTQAVGETDSHYLFRADSPGMSEFAIGAKRPEFTTYWAEVDEPSTDPGEDITVSGRVSNVGAADGIYEASLVVDGEVVSTRTITIAAGGTRQVNFRTDFADAGTYEVAVDDVSAGTVTVEAQSAGSEQESVARSAPVTFERLMDLGRAVGISVASLTAGH